MQEDLEFKASCALRWHAASKTQNQIYTHTHQALEKHKNKIFNEAIMSGDTKPLKEQFQEIMMNVNAIMQERTRSCGNSTVGRTYLSRMHEALGSIPRRKREEEVERDKRKEEEGTDGGKEGRGKERRKKGKKEVKAKYLRFL